MIDLPFDFQRGVDVLLTILTISLALCFVRLFLGPTIPNRTVAFDSISIHAVAILGLFAMRIGAPSILDAAIVVAVLGFLGTTMQARYLERAAPRYYALMQREHSDPQQLEPIVAPLEGREEGLSKEETERREANSP